MTPAFNQKHWSIVRADVVQFVRDFFDSGKFPDSINDTHIVLIPKKKNPSHMSDMRPISLCNVLYKIASKVVANRMKGVLNQTISETQSAFVAGRLISDNVMVAFEAMHYLKRKTKGKKGYMALKLDMSKAYDRVEWSFLESILRVMGFSDWWIGLTLSCVNSIRYHVINSGQKMGPIVPTRGIRQGCPLSPYLFIVCAEGLSSLVRHYEATRLITGCKVARSAPTISHLLFADDSYVYCQASEEEANHVLQLLQTFEGASGQKVNLHKSSAFFNSNTVVNTRNSICNLMHIQEAGEDSMYLGLPSIVGRNKNAVLGFLKERMRKRINGWEGRFLSRAGKEILIKTVVQSLPSYAMNVFLFPIGTCNELERMMASFWWKSNNSNGNGSGITWMSWDRMTKHKYDGGMGFRSLRDFNLAMIGKQVPVPMVQGLENFTVNSLFQVNNRCWDSDVVKDFFSPEDAAIILGIPIDQTGGDLKHHSANTEVNKFWKNLWTLKVPPKAKDLVWRAASNCLATKRNLCIKKVLVESICPLCGVFAETEWHVLVACDFAWSCFGFAGLATVARDSFSSLLPWLKATTSRVSSETLGRVIMLCWAIWAARNDLVWKQRARRVSDVVAFANLSLDQWINAQGKGNIPSLSPLKDGDGAEQWIKPSSGIKLNVDAAIFASLFKHGFGCVVRNSDGGLISAFAGVKDGSVSPELAEIIGIREAISWLKDHASTRAIIETDSLVCVEAIRSEETLASAFELVVDDCKNILKNLFNVSILFVKRSANRAAHYVARHSVSLAERVFSINSVPLNLMSILESDCSF
ncbi:uncharacterized protein LOC133036861 [Cannabis sativa]|uniref:uncharacterized protein LOC133036861 n=1 Tax=Cannabis sativa TaxID=3483 RepID=UPI0029CA2D42|nr:uncharacterized protein LOC133036861 [Cannabis sativa]